MSNTTIQLRHSTETGNVPVSLANGEIAINTQDGKLFYADPTGTVQEFSGFPGPSGLDTEIQFNDSGVLGANSRLTFDKTTGTLTANSFVTSGDFGNILAANTIYANNFVANTGFIQFSDGTKQFTANVPDTYARNHANAAFDAANSASGAEVTVSTFNITANGLVDTFDIGFVPVSAQAVFVTIDGVAQPETSYSVNTSANTITFGTTPVDGESIRVVSFYTAATAYVINDGSVTPEKLAPATNTFITTTAESSAIALAIALG